jgi:hypothetical protein
MIYSYSKFNYGINITTDNRFINFSEGGPELTAVIDTGDYALEQFPAAVQAALNDAGALTYTVTVDRNNNNVMTITGSGTFSLLINTGSNNGNAAWTTMGFVYPGDLTGASTYDGSTDCGEQYFPQFLLQSYVDRLHSQKSYEPTVNKTPSGRVEVVRFGLNQFFEMDVKFITDKPMDGCVIKNNASGVADAVDFLEFVSQKNKFEFVPDVDQPSTFFKVILESYPGFSDGTGFKLKELFTQNLPDIYETGVFILRVVP